MFPTVFDEQRATVRFPSLFFFESFRFLPTGCGELARNRRFKNASLATHIRRMPEGD